MNAERLAQLLINRNLRVATAESCTAGRLAAALCELEGASRFFAGGYVAYQKAAKTNLLGVPAEILKGPRGAVTAAVAGLMAEGARAAVDADVAVATTGVFGPKADEDGNPVGMVCLGIATRLKGWGNTYLFEGDPEQICLATINAAIELLEAASL